MFLWQINSLKLHKWNYFTGMFVKSKKKLPSRVVYTCITELLRLLWEDPCYLGYIARPCLNSPQPWKNDMESIVIWPNIRIADVFSTQFYGPHKCMQILEWCVTRASKYKIVCLSVCMCVVCVVCHVWASIHVTWHDVEIREQLSEVSYLLPLWILRARLSLFSLHNEQSHLQSHLTNPSF